MCGVGGRLLCFTIFCMKKVTLTQGEGATQGYAYVGDATDGATLLSEENLPEVVCARLGSPDPKERGVGEGQ